MYRVLLADDEKLERMYLKSFFEKQCTGYMVVGEACNGREAIKFFQQTQPDIIFMDVKMPGIDGLMATQKIKELNHRIKIIILSAYEDFKYVQQALRIGADEYLLKPAQPNEILSALKQVHQKLQNNQFDFCANTGNIKENSPVNYYPLDKEKTIITALKQNDLKLFTATFDEFTNQLLKSTNTTSTFKIRLFELIIILSRTLADFGLNEAEIRQFVIKNFETICGINVFTEVKTFIESLKNRLIETVNINNQSGKELIKRILNYINTHFANDLSLDSLSQRFHFSSCHISRLIKKETGLTYPEYLNQIRLKEAKKLLRSSDLTTSKIAHEVGYNEVSHFNRIFKKTIGITPSRYRNMKIS
ncbi:MAG: response regulator [Dehalobacterium sp.]